VNLLYAILNHAHRVTEMLQATAILLPLLLAASVLRTGSPIPSCDAPTFGEERPPFRPGSTVVYDTIAFDAKASRSRADSQAVHEARIDIGVRCAIDVIASLGGLRTYEMLTSAHVCALQPSSAPLMSPHQRGMGFDEIALCRIEFGRDLATRNLVHVTLSVFASGGVVETDDRKIVREYEVRLVRYAGSTAWRVDSYVTRLGE
jgi:hypothetical protein